jgi:hypothetical protein
MQLTSHLRQRAGFVTGRPLAGCILFAIAVSGGPAIRLGADHATKTAAGRGAQTASTPRAVLWREPTDIESRNLFYGPGGASHQPHGPFTFVKEDLSGSSPKFTVVDDRGVRWKMKLGDEARPETVASRFLWAVGYFADEDYFLRDAQITQMPLRVHRGRKLIGADGSVHNVRLKREAGDRQQLGDWRWRDNPFNGTRELNGLRVLMAVINNWDLKDVNNACYTNKRVTTSPPVLNCEAKDVGSSFGSPGLERTNAASKGNLREYARSRFITKVTATEVNFDVPRRAAWIVLGNPGQFFSRLPLRWIGRGIPRADARWMGRLLARLSSRQLDNAFRAAGYSRSDIEGFTAVLKSRIAQLNGL